MKIKEIRVVEIEFKPETDNTATDTESSQYISNESTHLPLPPRSTKKRWIASSRMEKARMYRDSGRWHLGVRYLTSWRSSDSNHLGLLCPTSHW